MISDIRSRTVSSWWLLAFGIPNIIFLGLLYGWKCVTGRVIGDLLLLLVIGTALLVYAKAKHMQLAELFRTLSLFRHFSKNRPFVLLWGMLSG